MNRLKIFRFIILLLIPVIWKSIYALFLGSVTILSAVGLIGTSTYLISYAAFQPSIAELQVAIVGVRFFGLSRSIFRYLERVSSHSVNLQMVSGLRLWFYKKLEPLIPARTSFYASGDLTTRALQDLETLDQVFIRVIAPPAIAVFVVLVTSLMLFSINPQLGWYTLVSMTLLGGIILLLSIATHKKLLTGFVIRRSNLYSLLGSMLEGIADIRINGNGQKFNNTLQERQKEFSDIQTRTVFANAFLNSLQPITSGLGMILILHTAARIAGIEQLDPILVGVTALIVMTGYEAFQPFPLTGSTISQVEQSLKRIFEIVDQNPEIVESKFPAGMHQFRTLKVEKLVFHYPGNRGKIFDGLTFDLEAGKKVALVGPSGAGKSSLISILLRYWEYPKGSIRINGIELRDYSSIDIRNLIRASSQTPYFFPISLRENLLLAYPAATDQDIHSALETTLSMGWVSELPQDMDTVIGERAIKLSEGQRKRLDVARALIAKPEILILDEPYSGIDYPTERKLNESLLSASGCKTMILITHHLVDLQMYDEILFMEKGIIVEKGDYSALLETGGKFSRMHDLQKNIFQNT